MRIRVAGIILIDDKLALMHRKNVKNRVYDDYYTFAGGGLEEYDNSLEEGCIREVKEEFGIDVKVEKLLYEYERNDNFNSNEKMHDKNVQAKEYFYLCSYVSGEFGKGEGPEFSNNPEYSDSGDFLPELVEKDRVEDIFLLPEVIKKKIVKDIQERNI